MAEEWKPVEEEKPAEAVVEETKPAVPEGIKNFLDETKKLFEQAEKEVKAPEESPKPEEVEEKKPEIPKPPPLFESAVPKETGFVPDFDKATPEQLKKRISYLYAKTKEGERQFDEVKDFQRKQAAEIERLRAEQAKEKLQRSEAELDNEQLRVIDLLDRNSPNYDPKAGAQALRDLTRKDAELKAEREKEESFTKLKVEEVEKEKQEINRKESQRLIDDWSSTREYAQEGHPLYGQVKAWIQKAYAEAPPEITTKQILDKAEKVVSEYIQKHGDSKPKPEPKPNNPSPDGERLRVSQVIGTGQRGPTPTKDPSVGLNQRQRVVAEKLFFDPEKGITKAKAYEMYSQGLGE